MRAPKVCRLALVLALASAGACREGCDPGAPPGLETPLPQPRPAPTRTPRAAPPPEAPAAACRAPSLARSEPSTSAELTPCVDLKSPERKLSARCHEAGEPADLAALESAVAGLDPRTRARIAAIARVGRERGHNPRAFALLGDSMTVSWDFLEAFSARRRYEVALDDVVAERLATDLRGASSIVDYFRGARVASSHDGHHDSFSAPRAAKVGARAPWALAGSELGASPLDRVLAEVNPSVALVLFGGNDAAHRVAPPEQLADAFERDLRAVVDALTSRGVVPVLHTVAHHLDQPGVPNCADGDQPSDHRVAVATSAISRRAAKVACEAELPLIDLREAFEGLLHHGLGPDGVHPSVHPRGGGILTREGLACGHNVRNYVTLRSLGAIYEALEQDGGLGPDPG